MGAPGHYWFSLHEFPQVDRYEVQVFYPLEVNCFGDLYIQPTETHSKDAFVIASILRYGKITPTVLPRKNIQTVKTIVRHTRFLTEQMTQVKNNIRSMLDEILPNYQREPFFPDPFGQAPSAFLRIAPFQQRSQLRL